VYKDDLDNVVGMLHAIDVVKALAAGNRNVDAASIAHEALTVPETMTADDLVTTMRQRSVREAVVIDEYGGTAGLVTFEWLMERIVGVIGNTTGAGRISVHEDGSAEVDGLTLVPDVNEQFGIHIDEETFTTLGGFVMGRIGRRARLGDTIEIEARRMRVVALDGLRVARVWISKPSVGSKQPEGVGDHDH
jgi:putative hemolysin